MREIVRDDDIMFELKLLGSLLALARNNSKNIPVVNSQNPSSEEIKEFYVMYCAKLDRKTYKAYVKNLTKRLENAPDELVIPYGDPSKKEELDETDLKAYDALCIYAAKMRGQEFEIDKDGQIYIVEEQQKVDIVKKPTFERELKSIDDEYYRE